MITALSPPGPKGHWLLGCLPEFRRDMLAFYRRMAADHGDLAAFRLGNRRLMLASHPDLVEQVLVTDNRYYVKPYIYQFLRPVLGNGLLLSEGEFWLRQRRLMQPVFNRARLEGYGLRMVEQTQKLIADWQPGQTRDLHAEMMRLALGIVAKTLLDVEAMDTSSEVAAALETMMDDFSYRFESLVPMPLWVPTRHNRQMRRAQRQLDGVLEAIIKQRHHSSQDHGDLLSMLMAARDEGDGARMTDEQLRNEVMTLFLAGHETTANALSWTWYLLAENPEVEVKLRAELTQVLGGRLPTPADAPRLTYTERVVQEAMRLYPPVYTFSRRAVRDCTLGSFHVPANTTVLMSQWVLHHDSRYFDNPDTFDPDRWGAEKMKKLPKYAYFPFGGGPRLCIGNSFAMLEAILVLATIVPRFRFTLAADQHIVPRPSITLRPAEGIRMHIAPSPQM